MALIANIDATNPNGKQVLEAINLLRLGFSKLYALNGLRAESLGTGQAAMAANFGVSANDQAQALSDRWVDVLDKLEDTGVTQFDKLRELLNATNQL